MVTWHKLWLSLYHIHCSAVSKVWQSDSLYGVSTPPPQFSRDKCKVMAHWGSMQSNPSTAFINSCLLFCCQRGLTVFSTLARNHLGYRVIVYSPRAKWWLPEFECKVALPQWSLIDVHCSAVSEVWQSDSLYSVRTPPFRFSHDSLFSKGKVMAHWVERLDAARGTLIG